MKVLNRDFLSVLVFRKMMNVKPQDRIEAKSAKQKDEVFPQCLPNPSLYDPTTAEIDNEKRD